MKIINADTARSPCCGAPVLLDGRDRMCMSCGFVETRSAIPWEGDILERKGFWEQPTEPLERPIEPQ